MARVRSSAPGRVVNNFHERGHSGRTLMVTGVAEEGQDRREVTRLRGVLHEGRADHDERFIRISSELVSGRRTHRADCHARSRAATRVTPRAS